MMPPMNKPIVLRKAECEDHVFPWGRLTWFASRALGNSQDMTVGRCIIHPGQANPKHSHPNCTEVLVVLEGTVAHTLEGDEDCTLSPGDVITVPPNVLHRAKNLGATDAVLMVTFSSADRQTKGE
jgi:quercetin dioxygenase-like cupin family protein